MSVSHPTPHTFRGDLRLYARLLTYVLPYKWVFLIALLGMLVVAGADMLFIWALQPIIDDVFVAQDPAATTALLLFLLAAGCARAMGSFMDIYCMAWVAERVVMNLRLLMFERLLYAPVTYYDHHSTAKLSGRLVHDVEQVADASTTVIRMLFKDFAYVLALLGLMFYHNWQLTLLFLVVVPLFYWVFAYSSKKNRVISRRQQKHIGEILNVAKDALLGQRLVKIFNAHEYQKRSFHAVNNRIRQQRLKGFLVGAVAGGVVTLVASIAFILIVGLALGLGTSVGEFGSYIVAMNRVSKPLRGLSQITLSIQGALAGAESVFKIIDLPKEDDSGAVTLKHPKGQIKFNQVWFSYHTPPTKSPKPPKPTKTSRTQTISKPSLQDVSFEIKAGSTVALVGESGSGKSTLAALLLRFYAPTKGSITLDEHDLNTLTLESLRRHIAIVTQEIVLIDDSIANNIAYSAAGNIDPKRLQIASEAANVMEFAQDFPHRLDTRIGEHGVRLSGGQRQRIAIARALYKDAPILIMDEATASLDSKSEQYIRDATEKLTRNRTSLVIAHRLSTIESADNIVVLNKGMVVEQGSHARLIRQKGAYASLHRAQYRKQKAN